MTRLNPDYAAWRRVFIRTVASLACIAAVVGLGGTIYAYRQIDRAERSARLQIHQLDAIVAQLAVTLRTTGTTAANAAASVDAAKTTLATTASTTRDAAVTLDNTGTTVDIAIPGFGHPFAEVKEELHDLSIQLGTVATDLDLTGTALIQNGRDLHAINADVADLAAQMDDTAAEIRRFADAGGTLSSLALTARLLLGWVVVLHLILLGLGLALGCLTVESVAPGALGKPRITEQGGQLTGIDETLPHLAVIDVLMPGLDGFAVAGRLRQYADMPVIMLTAIDDPARKVEGLAGYADDYVTKPFAYGELLARIRNLLQRAWPNGQPVASTTVVDDVLTIDFARHLVIVGGEERRLSPTEARLLHLLVKNRGRILLNELLHRLWPDGNRAMNSLWEYIRRLREKLGDASETPHYVGRERDIGYRFRS